MVRHAWPRVFHLETWDQAYFLRRLRHCEIGRTIPTIDRRSETMTEPADSAALWDDLKKLIGEVVEEMNRLEELRIKTGGLEFQLGETDSIIVTRQSLPNMSISISHGPEALEIKASMFGTDIEPTQAQESLAVEIHESGPSFRTETGEVFNLEETVYYILRPFLHFNSVAS